MTDHRELVVAPGAGVLSREAIRARIFAEPALIRDWRDLETQLQPNGFDLTLEVISAFAGDDAGALAVDNAERRLPEIRPVAFDADGWAMLPAGIYQVRFNEAVALPLDLMALGRPRSSLNRCGATIHTAVWDAGYEGRSTALLSVLNRAGFRVQRNARILQLVFFALTEAATEGYRGVYHGENLKR
jgi:dUTP pyrophosphatase